MATGVEATILVKVKQTASGRINNTTGSKKSGTSTTKNSVSAKNEDLDGATGALIIQGVKQVVAELGSLALDQFNRYMSLTDNIQAQRNLTNATNIISRSVNIGSSIVQGALIGGVVGITVATTTSAISLGIDIWKNYQAQQDNMNKLQVQLDYSRERSGYSLTSGGR